MIKMPPNYIYIYIVYIQYGSKINFKPKKKKKKKPLRWLGWNDSQNMVMSMNMRTKHDKKSS
jgi:hypothetical protein